MAEDAFALAPAQPYGYLRLKQLVPTSFAELEAALRGDLNRQIALVWTPLQSRLTPPEEVPLLAEALAAGERRRAWQGLRLGVIQLLMWGTLIATVIMGRQASSPPIYLLYVLSFGLLPLVENAWTLWRIRAGRWAAPSAVDGRFRAWVQRQPERWSKLLVVALLAVGLAQLGMGLTHFLDSDWSSIQAAGLVKPAVRSGELWRLMTGPLLHGNPIHFIFNAIALFALGKLGETLVTREAMAVTFVLSALAGSLCSLAFVAAPSVGASGGIMGLLGLMIALGLRRRGRLPRAVFRSMLVAAALIVVTGLVAYQVIDNAAHAGGFLVGLAIGWSLIPAGTALPTWTSVRLRWAGRAALALVAVFSVAAILAILHVLPLR